MKDYSHDKRLDDLLGMVQKTKPEDQPKLPLPESFWVGIQSLQAQGMDLEWTRGVKFKKTVFERLGFQLITANLDAEGQRWMVAEFERLWKITGRPASMNHVQGWQELLGKSYAVFSNPRPPLPFERFVEWALQARPATIGNNATLLVFDAAVCMDRPDLFERAMEAFPQYPVRWANLAGRGGEKMLHYFDRIGLDFKSPPPGTDPADRRTLEELIAIGPGKAADMVGPFVRQKAMDANLPKARQKPGPSPRF